MPIEPTVDMDTLRARLSELADSSGGQWAQLGLDMSARERAINVVIDQIIALATQQALKR